MLPAHRREHISEGAAAEVRDGDRDLGFGVHRERPPAATGSPIGGPAG
jgi:hypothetical protein